MMTDEDIVQIVLEATGLEAEFGDAAAQRFAHLVNINIAREWLAANNEVKEKLAAYRATSNQVEALRKQMGPIRDQLLVAGIRSRSDHETQPELGHLKQQESELIPIRNAHGALYKEAFDKAWSLSKKLIAQEPKPPKQKATKDYQRLVEYWDRKLDGVIYRLNRAKGALETAQKHYERVSNRGKDLVHYFPLGMVGGSGRNVKKLNDRKGNDLDRLIDVLKRLDAAKARVARLQATFDRYQTNYEKALEHTR